MSFLAPAFFISAVAVAAGVVALHFIVPRQPRAAILPTARFIPDMPATAVARATRPTDVQLLILRGLAVLAIGAGLARPVFAPSRAPVLRIVLGDVSRSVAYPSAMRDSLNAVYREGDVLVLLDSSARVISAGARDSINSLVPSTRRGSLSAALITAIRVGSIVREEADSLELVIVSPFHAELGDAALAAVRELWPGGARLMRTESPPSEVTPAAPFTIRMQGGTNDPLRVTATLATPSASATIVRDGSHGDGNPDGILVDWPSEARPRGALARARGDTVGGLVGGNVVLVSSFPRRWEYPPDSLEGATVIARWIDGEPAAVEFAGAAGCVRSIAVPVSSRGDLAIRTEFVRFVEVVTGPCAQHTPFVQMSPDRVAMLEGGGSRAPREAFAPMEQDSWIAPWLVGIGIALLLVSWLIQRRGEASVRAASRRRMAGETEIGAPGVPPRRGEAA